MGCCLLTVGYFIASNTMHEFFSIAVDLDALLRARTEAEQEQAVIEQELGLEMDDEKIAALFAKSVSVELVL